MHTLEQKSVDGKGDQDWTGEAASFDFVSPNLIAASILLDCLLPYPQ